MQILLRRTVYALILLCSACAASAQVAIGTYPYGTYDTPGIDTINVGNLNVHLAIPVLNKAGRGIPFNYTLSYDSSVWYPSTSGNWTPVQSFGWQGDAGAVTGYLSYSFNTGSLGKDNPNSPCPNDIYTYTIYSSWVYHDSFGVSHPFNGTTTNSNCSPTPSLVSQSTDGSGYTLNISNYTQGTITSSAGSSLAVPNENNGLGTITDSNGNEITSDGEGHFTDTTGNVVLTIAGSAPSPHTFIYKDTDGNSQTVTMTYKTYTVQTAFGCTGVTDYPATSTSLVNTIEFPDGSTYTFSYEPTPGTSGSVTGRLASIELPQNGVITYTYTGSNHGIECADGSAAGLTRTLTSSAGSAASNWTYARTVPSSTTSQTAVVDGLLNHKAYTFVQASNQPAGTTAQYYETSRSVQQLTATPAVLARNTCYNGAVNPCTTTAVALPIFQIDNYETLNGLATHGFTVTFNSYGGETEADIYDFASGSARGSRLREEVWTYNNPVPSLPSKDDFFDGGGNEAGYTLYGYDGTTLTASSGVPQHVTPTCPCGNLTSETLYANATTSYPVSVTYEDTGSILTSTGPSGTTTLGYDSTFVYNTSVTPPTPSSGVALGSSASYDTAYTGLPLVSSDPNSQKTKITSYNSMLQPTEEQFPDGGQTTWTYTPTLVTTTTLQTAAGVSASNEVQYDGYGRVSRTATANGQSTNPYYQQDTCYDANGNLVFQSYTYQSTGLTAAKGCSVSGSTVSSTVNGDTYAYDVLGRLTKITRANGESLSYAYNGRATESTDENSNQRISQIDGLGRPTIVCEISSGAGLVNSGSAASCGADIAGTGFTTTYAYALSTGTTTINQGGQTRTFQADWLGRTTSITEPESGTTTYSYAYNTTGLVVTRTRPKANQTSPTVTTTTTTQYDKVGRPISIAYSDGTPTKTFAYDAPAGSTWTNITQLYPKGRLSVAHVPGAASVYNYDTVGRVQYLDTCLPSAACGAGNHLQEYLYDLAGDLTASNDGAGVASHYTVTPAFELNTLTSSVSNGENPAELISSVSNGPNGPISYTLGNGLSAANRYDTLGRFNGTWVCSGSASTYCSGGTQIYGNTVDSQVGIQIKGVSDTALNQGVGFGYDQFNRLTSRIVNSGAAQNFTYTYDRWGNRWSQTVTSGSGPQPNYSFNTSTNQITSAGFTYDAAGNMTNDGSHTYTYDAEGNITAVDGGTTAQYTYNALNQRVQTLIQGFTTEFVFNQNGQRVSIWNGATNTVLRDQYYWGSKPVAFAYNGQTYFQHQDYLGTERMRTAYNGASAATFTSLPFGDAQTTASGSNLDAYHFAGLDGDIETGTDHAQFRQYSSTQGRWMRPDPYYGSCDSSNPQSLNRYSYALNSPLTYTDPSGLLVQIGNCLYAELASDDTILDQDGNVIGTGGGGTYGLQFLFCGSAGGGGGGGGGGTVGGGGGGGGGSAPSKTGCFARGVAVGAGGALLVAGAAVGAVALGAPAAVVTGALLLAGGIGGGLTAASTYNDIKSGNYAGAAYNVGSVVGGVAVGGAVGGAVGDSINPPATRG